MGKWYWVFLIIFLIPHFLFLGRFPVGMNHDEAEVMMSAISFSQANTDYSGVSFPRSLFQSKTEAGIASLASYLLSFIIFIFPQNTLMFRIYFVLINLATVYVLARLVRELTNNDLLFKLIILLGLISPWMFYYSRATTEAPFALLLSLLGIYYMVRKEPKMGLSAGSFILAFFSYYGAKVVVPPLAILTYLFFYKDKNLKKSLSYLLLIITPLIVTLMFTSREGELIFSDLDNYSQITNEIRRTSISTPITFLVFNKYYFLGLEMVRKFFMVFEINTLFYRGDPRATYNLEWHGLLYLIDAAAVVTGVYALAKKKFKKLAILLVVFLISAPLATTLSQIETSIIFRGFLVPIIFVVLAAVGLLHFKKYLIPIMFIYLVFFINFLMIYFTLNPVRQQENNYFSEKVLAEYIKREGKKATIVAASPYQINLMLELYKTKKIYKAINVCPELDESLLIIESRMECEYKGEPYVIQQQKDSGAIFKIYNGSLCEGVQLNEWRRTHEFSDYRLSIMRDNEFCERWIQKIKN